MEKNFVTFLFIFILFCSCNSDNDYKKHSSGLEYKILKQTENSVKTKKDDIIELKLRYFTETDSLIFNSEELTSSFKMKVKPSSHQGGSFEDAILMMSVGDRYKFKINADSFYTKTKQAGIPSGINIGSKLIFDVEILRIVSKEEIEKERDLQNRQMKRQENVLLMQYVEENKINTNPMSSGLYYIEKKQGKGKKAMKGDTLKVHYIGKLLNGQVFDSSYDRNEMFAFALGDLKIIKGWNEGFSLMNEGGEAIFIIPSELAYGKKGYSTIIPPFSCLIFEVKLIKIN